MSTMIIKINIKQTSREKFSGLTIIFQFQLNFNIKTISTSFYIICRLLLLVWYVLCNTADNDNEIFNNPSIIA